MLQSQKDRLHFTKQTLTGLAALGSLFVAGCSKEPATVNPANGSNAAVESGDSGTSAASTSGQAATSSSGKSRQRGRDEIYEDEKGQKWFGQVPYDVFFDKPLEVARDTTPVGGGTSNLAGTSNPAGDSGTATTVASTDNGPEQLPWRRTTPLRRIPQRRTRTTQQQLRKHLQRPPAAGWLEGSDLCQRD